MEQRSNEWYLARLGKVTGSRIHDVMAKGKGNAPSVTRHEYMCQLVCERLTGEPMPNYVNAAMQWGVDNELEAKLSYEFSRGVQVKELAFANHFTIKKAGASPDGLIGDDGLIEIKCPNTATHIATLKGKSIDPKYIKQMQWQMACTSRLWCDFTSFDPRLPFHLQMHVIRVERDNEMIGELEDKVQKFLQELDELEQELMEMNHEREAA